MRRETLFSNNPCQFPPAKVTCAVLDLPHRYEPWIGSIYAAKRQSIIEGYALNGQLGRDHVMGESHYIRANDEDAYNDSTSLTQQVFDDWCDTDEKGGLFFKRVLSVLETDGIAGLATLRRGYWQNYAFSNFIQFPVSDPRQHSSKEQVELAGRSFVSQLQATLPTILLVLGKRTWQELPANFGIKVPVEHYLSTDFPVDAWLYPFRYKAGNVFPTIAVNVIHPSASIFNAELARKQLKTVRMIWSNVIADVFESGATELIWLENKDL